MARPQKPWYRKQTGWWMVEIDGKQEKLVKGPKNARHRQLAEEKLWEVRRLRRVAPQSADARAVDVIDAFLASSRQNNAPDLTGSTGTTASCSPSTAVRWPRASCGRTTSARGSLR